MQARSQVEQARQRLLRHPRPGAREGAPDGGRGPAHHQAEHRQHRRVRPRAARRDRAGHDPQPAATRPATPTARACSRRARRSCTTRSRSTSRGVTVDDVYLGNGASELIAMSMNALLNDGDEVLIPAPDYPLWTAVGRAVRRHAGALPLRRGSRLDARPRRHRARRSRRAPARSSSSTRTTRPARSIPTSVLREIVELARQHQLIVFADEIYDKTLYDGDTHTSIASLADDVLFLTFNGLSKNYRACGYRAGWMVVSGEKRHAARLHRGPRHAGVDAAVLEHAGPARDPDRARRLPEHRRPGRAGRPPVPPARPRATSC